LLRRLGGHDSLASGIESGSQKEHSGQEHCHKGDYAARRPELARRFAGGG
jgi:hypothetical protein